MQVCGRDIRVEGRLIRVGHLDGDGFKFLNNPEQLLDELRRFEKRIDLFTFMQELPNTSPKHPYPMEWDNVAVLPISTFDNWWTHQISKKTRNKARLTQKRGLSLREVPFNDELVKGIWQIYNECPVRQGRLFPHYGKSIEAVRKMSETFLDSSIFLGAFDAEELIGFVKLTTDDTRTQAGIMHILSMLRYRDKAPMNGLIMQAVRSCVDRGISYLVYANFAYGKKLRSSLSDFKERNGFQRVDIPRYYVPLTRWGSLAFAMRLHRRLAEQVPEPVAAKLRELRSAWYQHKSQLSEETL